jgi:hypothetical protein
MAQFGWAYVNCSSSGGTSAAGPSGSLQFMTASGQGSTTGSVKLTFHEGSGLMTLTGSLRVSGSITASHYHIENVTQIDVSGSTFFGNTNDDRHVRTGSLEVVQADGTPLLHVTNSNGMVNVRGFAGRYTIVSTATATASVPSYIIGVRHTSNVEILIPSASTYGSGAVLVVKDEVTDRGGTNIRLTASVGYLIDNTIEYILTGSMPAISLYSNGANWFVF